MKNVDNTAVPLAVTSLKVEERDVGRFPANYTSALRRSGGTSVVLSPFDDMQPPGVPHDAVVRHVRPGEASALDGLAGLVLTGGGDVDPALYGRWRHPRTHNVSRLRDRFELGLLEGALAADMPVLAICRGMQLLNVCLGGTLEQHLADRPRRLPHDRDRPRAEPSHDVAIAEGSLLAKILDRGRVAVNSHHHQGLDEVADPLEPITWAEDGVLEAVSARTHSWVLGVQWHPEVMAPVHPSQAAIFGAFVDAAANHEHGLVSASGAPKAS